MGLLPLPPPPPPPHPTPPHPPRRFILHNKHFDERVAKTSITCPAARRDLRTLYGSEKPPFKLLELGRALEQEGSYMLSEFGVCNLDSVRCRRQFFPTCRPRDLENVTGVGAIRSRVAAMETHRPVGTFPLIPPLEDEQRCAGTAGG